MILDWGSLSFVSGQINISNLLTRHYSAIFVFIDLLGVRFYLSEILPVSVDHHAKVIDKKEEYGYHDPHGYLLGSANFFYALIHWPYQFLFELALFLHFLTNFLRFFCICKSLVRWPHAEGVSSDQKACPGVEKVLASLCWVFVHHVEKGAKSRKIQSKQDRVEYSYLPKEREA